MIKTAGCSCSEVAILAFTLHWPESNATFRWVSILPQQSAHTNTTGWHAAAIPLTTSPSTCTKTIRIALVKNWETPWRWFLREPKHVGVFNVT
jgi:hypothetical protein